MEATKKKATQATQEGVTLIPHDIRQKIIYLHTHEKWKPGTIARQVCVHHNTVKRALRDAGIVNDVAEPSGKAMIEPFIPFILEQLERNENLTGTRLHSMCVERGYCGAVDHFRAMLARYRPRKKPEAFLKLATLPGEQGQVDWGCFGRIRVGRALRPLNAFVSVLSWSRDIYLEFFCDQQMSSFLQGHNSAFAYFGGAPRTILYDNLKLVVTERHGDAVRFNREFLAYAGKIGFEPRPVAIRRGNEKGRVERAIRYIRGAFFAGLQFKDLDDLNTKALHWCRTTARARSCAGDSALTVGQAAELEKKNLRTLPNCLPAAEEQCERRVPKTPYVRVDGNDYSVPCDFVLEVVTVFLSRERVRIVHEHKEIANHQRCYSQHQTIELAEHIEELRSRKAAAHDDNMRHQLTAMIPSFTDYILAVADEGYSLGSTVAAISRLVDSYGPSGVDAAIREAMEAGQLHTGAVSLVLDRKRLAKQADIPLPITLPSDPRCHNINVRTPDLANYDNLSSGDIYDGD